MDDYDTATDRYITRLKEEIAELKKALADMAERHTSHIVVTQRPNHASGCCCARC